MFLTHADDTHDSFFPKVFPITEAETETYPDLSQLVAIYHTCPTEQYIINSIPKDDSVYEWLEYHSDKEMELYYNILSHKIFRFTQKKSTIYRQ